MEVPGLEIFQVSTGAQVTKFLDDFQGGDRCVTLCSHAPTALSFQDVTCMYKHDLPANQSLGLHFEGFPPMVSEVNTTPVDSFKVIRVGQYVESILMPSNRPALTTTTPGFNGKTVRQKLEDTNHLEGRQLVLKELTEGGVQRLVKTKFDKKTVSSENAPFDVEGCKPCCCM